MIRRPPRSTQRLSSAASDVYKRQLLHHPPLHRLMAKARPHHKKIIHHHNENAIAFSLIFFGSVEKVLGIESALLPNREWGQKQKHKKQP